MVDKAEIHSERVKTSGGHHCVGGSGLMKKSEVVQMALQVMKGWWVAQIQVEE